MRWFLHVGERDEANLVKLAHFFERPANARVARESPAAIWGLFKGSNGGGHWKAPSDCMTPSVCIERNGPCGLGWQSTYRGTLRSARIPRLAPSCSCSPFRLLRCSRRAHLAKWPALRVATCAKVPRRVRHAPRRRPRYEGKTPRRAVIPRRASAPAALRCCRTVRAGCGWRCGWLR